MSTKTDSSSIPSRSLPGIGTRFYPGRIVASFSARSAIWSFWRQRPCITISLEELTRPMSGSIFIVECVGLTLRMSPSWSHMSWRVRSMRFVVSALTSLTHPRRLGFTLSKCVFNSPLLLERLFGKLILLLGPLAQTCHYSSMSRLQCLVQLHSSRYPTHRIRAVPGKGLCLWLSQPSQPREKSHF